MMKLINVILLSLVSTASIAATNINETMDAAEDGDVKISNISGSVEVRGWSRNQVEITGDLGSNVEELVFERKDDKITIKVKVPRNNSGRIESNLVINVPEASSLYINTVTASIEVEDVLGDQQLNSVTGKIESTVYDADIGADSVSGHIEIAGNNEACESRFGTVSGNINAENLNGTLRADSVSGHISVVNSEFERVSIDTVSGSIVIHAGLLDDGKMNIETINGSVDVDFGGDVSARIDVQTFNGSIKNCFGPESVKTNQYTPGRELEFTEGGGSGRVRINTLNGSVRLCK